MSISRRTLIAAATGVAGISALGSARAGQDRKIGFAIAGLGGFARGQILPAFKETKHCKVAAFVTSRPEEEYELADELGVPRENVVTYDDIGKLKGRDGVDALYVITPTGLHMRHTLAGLDAGLHVLCEKPMAQSVDECDRMIQAAKDAGKKLMIAYRVHYEPHNLRAIEWARNHHKGEVRLFDGIISYAMGGQPTWRNDPTMNGGGGPLPDLGIYMLNASRYITGEEPTHVVAQTFRPEGNPLFPEGVESRCAWQFKFPSGAIASCSTSYDTNAGHRYRVGCTGGWYELEPATAYGGIRMYESARDGRREVEDIPPGNQFVGELDHFAECILGDKAPKTPGEEGRQDIHLIQKIYQSAAQGRELEM